MKRALGTLTRVAAAAAAFTLVGSSIALAAADPMNLLTTTDFSTFVLAVATSIDPDGSSDVMTFSSEAPIYTFASTRLNLDPVKMKRLKLTYKYKVEGVVQGKETWNTARLMVSIFDSAGSPIPPQWQTAGFWKGTMADYKQGSFTVTIPKDAETALIEIGLHDCSGTFSMKDLIVYALDANKNPVAPLPLPEE